MAKEENKKELWERIKSEQMAIRRITNEDLKCKDCVRRFDDTEIYSNTSKCLAFKLKPSKVLGGGDCSKYSKE